MLSIGESKTAEISAKQKWNDTGIHLIADQEYRFEVDEDDMWTDWYIRCNADGFDSPWYMKSFEWSRRVSSRKWFELIGALNSDIETCFPIGTSSTRTMSEGGVLTCFANDSHWAYGNNKGSVKLTVTRTR